MKTLLFNDPRVVEFASKACCAHWIAPATIGVEENGQVIGGCVFSDMLPGVDISLSIAGTPGRYWGTRRFFMVIFRYLFKQLKLQRATCLVDVANAPSINLCTRLGFQYEGTLRARGDNGRDVLVFGMLKSECHWLDREMANE